MAAQSVVEAAAEASSSTGKTGQPLRVLLQVKWLGSNALFTTDMLDVYASSHVDGASQAAMLQQKLAQLMPKPPVWWYGQVCLRAGTGAALTMHPNNLKNYLNAFENLSCPPKTEAQTRLDKAWDALAQDALCNDVAAKDSSSAAPVPASVTLFATQYSSTDAAIAWLQINGGESKNLVDFFKTLDQATKDNPRFVLCCIEKGIWASDCSDKVNASKRVVLRRVEQHDNPLKCIGAVPDHVLHDKEVSEAILEKHGWNPECFAKYNLPKCGELQKYAQVMFDVERRKLHKPAKTYLRNDVLQRVKMNGNALKLHVQYTDDKEIVLAAASSARNTLSYRFLAWLESDMQDDEDVVYAALKNGASIEGASTRLQGDLRCARFAVAHNAGNLGYVSDELRKHRGLVLAACKKYGLALKHAHETLKDDLEVVLVACRSDAEAIEFASPRLRKSESVFLAVCASLKRQSNYCCYSMRFLKYVEELWANFKTAPPSNKVIKQFLDNNLIRKRRVRCDSSLPTYDLFVNKSTVMWFIKTNASVAGYFFDRHSIRYNLDFACKCAHLNWEVFGLLNKHYCKRYSSNYWQMSDQDKERLRSAAIAGFGAAKAAAEHWMATVDIVEF